MQNVLVSVAYDTNRPSRWPGAYTVALSPTDRAATGALAQQGAVENNIVRYGGVFASEPAAAEAVLRYVGSPAALIEISDVMRPGARMHAITAIEDRHRARPGESVRLLARRTRQGIYVADPL